MNPQALCCTRCTAPLPGDQLNASGMTTCRACGSPLRVAVFPALLAGIAPGRTGEALRADDEASCYYHLAKRAVVPCDNCGRFLCALCDVEMGSRHLCPACIEVGDGHKMLTDLDPSRVQYDTMALLLAAIPFGATGVLALFLAVRHWKRPMSLAPRSRARWVLAIAIAFGQIAAWCVLFWSWS